MERLIKVDPQFEDKLDKSNLKKFLHDFFVVTTTLPTVFSDTNEFQCFENKRRSFEDLLLLSKYYFPEVTDAELAKCLTDLAEGRAIDMITCPDIKRIVFYKNIGRSWAYSQYITDTYKGRIDGIQTMETILKLAGRNPEDLNKILNIK